MADERSADDRPSAPTRPREHAVNAWLVAHGATVSDEELVSTLARLLVDAGLPVDRLWIGRRTHHPLVVAYALEWTRSGARSITLPFARRAVMQRGPFAALSDGQIHRLLLSETPRGVFGLPEQLWDEYHSILVVTRTTADGSLAGFIATLGTTSPTGFPPTTEAILEAIFPTLNVVLLARSGLQFARSIATTYLGREVGARVYDGMIHRGEGETIRAAIWLSDLRGFSRLAEEHPLPALLQLLDDAFEAQVAAIEGAGGEVLKFMGDGLLAVFPAAEGDDGRAACEAALAAAADADARIAALRERRAAAGEPLVDHGVALHFGDVMLGNIGAPHRLDFTVIGPAVNLAARLETRCAPLGVKLVMSAAFAGRCQTRTREAERAPLKGVGEQAVFVLDV